MFTSANTKSELKPGVEPIGMQSQSKSLDIIQWGALLLINPDALCLLGKDFLTRLRHDNGSSMEKDGPNFRLHPESFEHHHISREENR